MLKKLAQLRLRVQLFQIIYQTAHRSFLSAGARIGQTSFRIHPACIADADAPAVQSGRMASRQAQRIKVMRAPALGYIKVVRIYIPHMLRAAVEDDKFDFPHATQEVMPSVPATVVNTVMNISRIFFQIVLFDAIILQINKVDNQIKYKGELALIPLLIKEGKGVVLHHHTSPTHAR